MVIFISLFLIIKEIVKKKNDRFFFREEPVVLFLNVVQAYL